MTAPFRSETTERILADLGRLDRVDLATNLDRTEKVMALVALEGSDVVLALLHERLAWPKSRSSKVLKVGHNLLRTLGRPALEGSGITDFEVMYHAAREIDNGSDPAITLREFATYDRDSAAAAVGAPMDERGARLILVAIPGRYPRATVQAFTRGLERARTLTALPAGDAIERLALVLTDGTDAQVRAVLLEGGEA